MAESVISFHGRHQGSRTENPGASCLLAFFLGCAEECKANSPIRRIFGSAWETGRLSLWIRSKKVQPSRSDRGVMPEQFDSQSTKITVSIGANDAPVVSLVYFGRSGQHRANGFSRSWTHACSGWSWLQHCSSWPKNQPRVNVIVLNSPRRCLGPSD